MLIVGDYWDPATNYAGAVAASKLLPNSRLLTSNSWGHTAYGTSSCVTNAVDSYLIGKKVPAKGKVCHSDYRPFAEPLDDEDSGDSSSQSVQQRRQQVAVAPVKPGLR